MLYAIKRLEWKPCCGGFLAKTIFGTIRVFREEWSYCFDEYYDEGSEICHGIDDGKIKAEQFYLSRILPALYPEDKCS